MTTHELLTAAQTAGITLEARGDRLHIEAPRGSLTPELRDTLAERKAELLALLAPPQRFVTLQPTGLTMPRAAVDFAMDLERRGFKLSVSDRDIDVQPAKALTPADRVALDRWRQHVVALTQFCDRVVV